MLAGTMTLPEQTAHQPEEPSKPKRSRHSYDFDDLLHSALERRAAKLTISRKRSVGISEALAELLEEGLAVELSELADSEQDKPKRRRS